MADYLLRYDYISKVLCENKNIPSKHCNGKCYLAKQMKHQIEENSESKNSNRENKLIENIVLYDDFNIVSIQVPNQFEQKISFKEFTDLYQFNLYQDFFHPPVSLS